MSTFGREQALVHLLDLFAVPGPTGQESMVAETITRKLLDAGVKKTWIKTDDAHRRLGDYNAFRLKLTEPCVKIAAKAVRAAGMEANPLVMDAGLDANNFNEKGLPTVTLGTGSHKFHQRDEYVEISEYLAACDVLLHIARIAAQ